MKYMLTSHLKSMAVSETLSAIGLGLTPVLLLICCFEMLVPNDLLAHDIEGKFKGDDIEFIRYFLFIASGAIHITICIFIGVFSYKNISSKLTKGELYQLNKIGIIIPFIFISSMFFLFCAAKSKLYLISFSRIINIVKHSDEFSYQFSACTYNNVISIFCSSGNFHLSAYSMILIMFGIISTLLTCADIGVSSTHHSKMLTPERLAISGSEMNNDINRYAVSLLVILTSSSITISIFQQIGVGIMEKSSESFLKFQTAGYVASMFWPIAFGSMFIGIFSIPALLILKKRGEALRLLDSAHIQKSDYESFFAVKQAIPQSLKWALMSGAPLILSHTPKLLGLPG